MNKSKTFHHKMVVPKFKKGFFKVIIDVYFMRFSVFLVYICLCTMCMQSPQGPEEGVRNPVTGIIDGYVPPCRCWEPSPSPVPEQQVPLTLDPSLQPCNFQFKKVELL